MLHHDDVSFLNTRRLDVRMQVLIAGRSLWVADFFLCSVSNLLDHDKLRRWEG